MSQHPGTVVTADKLASLVLGTTNNVLTNIEFRQLGILSSLFNWFNPSLRPLLIVLIALMRKRQSY